jgi:hypothetical protein
MALASTQTAVAGCATDLSGRSATEAHQACLCHSGFGRAGISRAAGFALAISTKVVEDGAAVTYAKPAALLPASIAARINGPWCL